MLGISCDDPVGFSLVSVVGSHSLMRGKGLLIKLV